jgi:hypothetical protein
MGRPKSELRTINTAIRLSEPMHRRLSEAGRGGLATEVKRRLEESLRWDHVDQPTRDLVTAVTEMAALIEADIGTAWHQNKLLRDALGVAVTRWLSEYGLPQNELAARDQRRRAEEMRQSSKAWLRPGDTPESAGARLTGLLRVAKFNAARNKQSEGI